MSTRYIADLHLYDTYSYDWRKELEVDVDGFAFMLINSWNSVYGIENDDIIIAGDIGKYCQRTIGALKQLKGRKILVVGNHDLVWGQEMYNAELFSGTYQTIQLNGIYVTHRPDIPADIRGKVNYVIHGHHHRYDMPNMQSELKRYILDVNRFNCCADLIGFKPRTLQELMLQKELLLEKYKEKGIIKEDMSNG